MGEEDPETKQNTDKRTITKHTVPTCTCLQSSPRAGNTIIRYVIGHFSEMRTVGCSTELSDPLHGTAVNPDCANPLLTAQQTIRFA